MEVAEMHMELVILSTLAAVAILLAELRDLARRERIRRSPTVPGPSRIASAADLAAGSRAANEQPATARRQLGRAA